MARLLDRLLQHGVWGSAGFRSWAREAGMETCERILIDDVSTYFYAHAGKLTWDWNTDFPNLAPPFATFWMEAPAPRAALTTTGEVVPTSGEMAHAASGVLAVGGRRPEGMSVEEFVLTLASEWGFLQAGVRISPSLLRAPVAWALSLALFIEHRPGRCYFGGQRVLWLDDQGRLVGTPGGTATPRVPAMWSALGPVFTSPVWARRHGSEAHAEAERAISSFLGPYGLAISLLHCKNVDLAPGPRPSAKLERAYERRHGRPMLTYRVLEVEPMKQVLRTVGRLDETGMRQALHICRGHFKDYRERGLFGRARGIYWWESHVRGNPELGAVIKDYRVVPAGGVA